MLVAILATLGGVAGAVNATTPKIENVSEKAGEESSQESSDDEDFNEDFDDDDLDESDYDDSEDDYDTEDYDSEDGEHPDITEAFNTKKLAQGKYSTDKLMTTGFSMNAKVLSTGKNKAGDNVILMSTDDVPNTYFLLIDKPDVTGDLSKGDTALFEGIIIGDTAISDSIIGMGISDEYYSEPAYLLQADDVY